MHARLTTALPEGVLASLTWLGRGRLPVPHAYRAMRDHPVENAVYIFAPRGTRVVAVNIAAATPGMVDVARALLERETLDEVDAYSAAGFQPPEPNSSGASPLASAFRRIAFGHDGADRSTIGSRAEEPTRTSVQLPRLIFD